MMSNFLGQPWRVSWVFAVSPPPLHTQQGSFDWPNHGGRAGEASKGNQYLPVSRFLLLSMSEISMLIQIIIFFFNSVETPLRGKLQSPAPLLYSQNLLLHKGFHHENEPGCSGLGRCFSRPYFLIYNCYCCWCIYCYCYYYYFFIYISFFIFILFFHFIYVNSVLL